MKRKRVWGHLVGLYDNCASCRAVRIAEVAFLLWTLLVLLLSCAARPQIQCTGREENILYLGPCDEKQHGEFVVYVDDQTTNFYRKAACRKV